MHRKIEFYRIIYEFLPLIAFDKSETELKSIFVSQIISSIKPQDPYVVKIDEFGNPSVLIEIINIKNDHLFGVIGKLEDLKDGILKRFRNKDDVSVVKPDKDEINLYIENYTYFYIRFADLICAVLSNPSAPRFRTHFTNYLKDTLMSFGLENLNIINVYDDKIDYKINHIRDLYEIRLVFDDSSIIGNQLLNLTDTFYLSQSSLKEASININLKMTPFKDETRKILKNSELVKTEFKKLEIAGTDENDENIEVELVERILTKKVFIDIDEKYLKSPNDLNKIKEALIKALPPTSIYQNNS